MLTYLHKYYKHIVVLILLPYETLANLDAGSDCILLEKSWKGEHIIQVEQECRKEYEECLSALNSSEVPDNTDRSIESICLNQPVAVNSEYRGRCPKLLQSSELSQLSDTHTLLAKFRLRNYFPSPKRDKFYKFDDSISDMYSILSMDPNNFSAIFNLLLFSSKINLPTDEHLYFRLKLAELEPNCHETWYYRAFFISLLSQRVHSTLTHDGRN